MISRFIYGPVAKISTRLICFCRDLSELTSACSGIESREKQQAGQAMKDYQAKAEQLRKEADDCAIIRDLATDQAKREIFDRLASHLTVLANQIEMAIIEKSKTQRQ